MTDPRLLRLINKWLKVPVCEDGKYTSGKGNGCGTPQGGVISPLLANIYFHLLDRIVNNAQSLFCKYGVKIVRYADDFVLMGKSLPVEITHRLKSLLDRMGLMINETKTRQIDAKRKVLTSLDLQCATICPLMAGIPGTGILCRERNRSRKSEIK